AFAQKSDDSGAGRIILGTVAQIDPVKMTITLKSIHGATVNDMDTNNTGFGSDEDSRYGDSRHGMQSPGNPAENSYGDPHHMPSKQSFTFSADTAIQGKDSSSMKASDIKVGDHVRMQLDSSNAVKSITITK